MNPIKTLSEYLVAVRNGIQNGDKIIEGLMIAAQVRNKEISDEALAEILRRKDICSSCPFNSKNAKEAKTYNSSLPYEHCILCSCRIGYDDSKEYCLSCNCGVTVWNKNHPDKKMEVKWTAFENNKSEKN
jgi:hypothetical protein